MCIRDRESSALAAPPRSRRWVYRVRNGCRSARLGQADKGLRAPVQPRMFRIPQLKHLPRLTLLLLGIPLTHFTELALFRSTERPFSISCWADILCMAVVPH